MSRDPMRFVQCDDPALDAAEATRALRDWVAHSWLQSRRVAREMIMPETLTPGAHRVRLETLIETRELSDALRPYRGEALDGGEHGAPPDRWQVEVAPPADMCGASVELCLPHTESAHTCSRCSGEGQVACGSCGGSGRCSCGGCGGSGSTTNSRWVTTTNSDGSTSTHSESYSESCSWCGGSGRTSCGSCGATGRVICPTCDGEGRVVTFTRLTVTWAVRRDVRILEHTEMPDELVIDAQALDVATLEGPAIEPIADSGDAFRGDGRTRVNGAVNQLINELLAEHRPAATVRNLRQRLTVSGVPVYEVPYRQGALEKRLWIYGADRRVHAPGFPVDRLRTLLFTLAAFGAVAAIVFVCLRAGTG